MTALEAAIKLREEGPTRSYCGLCNNLFLLGIDAYNAFELFLDSVGWDSEYPVEVNLLGMSPDEARDYYASCGDKWVGVHGASRMQLLNDFINWLEPEK